MLRFVFACLLLLNLGLLGWQLGGFDNVMSGHREPARLKNQLNANQVRVLPPPQAGQASAAPAAVTPPAATPVSPTVSPSAQPAPAGKSAPPSSQGATATPASSAQAAPAPALASLKQPACIEIGNLSVADGRRFEAALASLQWSQPPKKRELKEQSSHMVWIPPMPTGREGAERKSSELRQLGVTEIYVLQEGPAQRYGISLGVFKTEEAARAQLAKLNEKGVKSAKVVEYKMPFTRLSWQLRPLDERARAGLDKLKADFPRHEEKACEAASPA